VSNSLAIATVTAALHDLLDVAAKKTLGAGAKVQTGWPDAASWTTTSGVNLFLYEVTPNGALRNAALPTRTADGRTIEQPQAALNLRYLLTFYGKEADLEAQRLMGAAVSLLEARPLLDRPGLAQTIGAHAYLSNSNLDEQSELVRLTPLHLTTEELSRLWTTFPQSAYAPSLVYEGAVVLIDAEEDLSAVEAVRSRGVDGTPFCQPLIQAVEALGAPGGPIVAGTTLAIRGEQLSGAQTQIRIDGADHYPASETDTLLTLPLPPGLAAGVHAIQIVQPVLLGDPPTPHSGVDSNVAAFVHRPTAQHVSTLAQAVTIHVDPMVRVGQRVTLLLNEEPGGQGRSYRFERAPEAADADQLTFDVTGTAPATYAMRVQVDGAQSSVTETAPAQPGQPPQLDPNVTIW
jgi:hypothetical protein